MEKKTVSVYMSSQPAKKKPYRLIALFTAAIIVAFAIGFWMYSRFTSTSQSMRLVTTQDFEKGTTTLPEYPGYQLVFLSRDRELEKIYHQDASLLYVYMSNASDPNVHVLIGVSSSRDNLHDWEVGYPAWAITQGLPQLTNVLDDREVQLMEDPPITARFFVFEHPDNYTQVMLYWYEEVLFNNGTTVQKKHARISLIIFTRDQDYDACMQLEEKLLSLGRAIAGYLEPLK